MDSSYETHLWLKKNTCGTDILNVFILQTELLVGHSKSSLDAEELHRLRLSHKC